MRIGLLVLAACGRIGFDPLPNGASDYSKQITFAPLGGGTDLVDFPAAIIATDAELAAHARADGKDFAFASTTGDALAYEIEAWDPQSGALAAWVRVPVLAAATTTELELRYGGPAHETTANAVWASASGVWHMSFTDGTFRDSTAFANHGVAVAPALPAVVPGIVGPAASFDGIDDSVQMGDPSNGALDPGTGSFSYELWAFVTTNLGLFDIPWWKGGSALPVSGYDIELGTGDWRCTINDGTNVMLGTFTPVPPPLGTWHHVAVVVDRGAAMAFMYLDGARVEQQPFTLGSISSTNVAKFGGHGLDWFIGLVDETRVYRSTLSATWIAATYRNLSNPAQFYTIGPERAE